MIRKTFCGALCATAFALGCSNGSGSSTPAGEDAKRPSTLTNREAATRADRPSNGAVEVDESGLRGVARDGEIELSIPVLGLKTGKGSVSAELISVDHSKVKASASASYDLRAGEKKVLSVKLPLPDDVKQQADRAAYSLQVRDAAATLRVTRSLMYVLSPYELRLEGPAMLQADKQASYRVRAADPLTHAALPDLPVALDLKRGDETVRTLHADTDESGSAIFALDVGEAGAYSLAASSEDNTAELSGSIQVRPSGERILLTTDKPIYQPGQTIHLRAMALNNPGNTPHARATLTFEVLDGKGNRVFKKQRTTDDYGIASADFKLASLVNMGSYKLQVSGDGKAEKNVEVSRYVLPKFELRVATDRSWYAPGSEIRGTLDSKYFFGKAVNGADVTLEALTLDAGSQVFQRVMGKTDDSGHWAFSLQLPQVLAGIPLQDGNALVTLRARVADTAGQVVEKDTPLTVAAAAIRISLVPEATQLVTGLENRFHAFATDPLGAPIADAELKLSEGAPAMTVRTDAFGHAELRWRVEDATQAIGVELTTKQGEHASAKFTFEVQNGGEHVLVRTDKSLYAVGETAKVQVLASQGESRAYVDWLNEGQVVDMRTLELKDGAASFEVSLDQTLAGDNRVEAYVVDDGGNVVRAGRTIVVSREGALRVAVSQDKGEYRPGEAAKLTLSVTDADGKPAPSALGVQIVDEAVFGLIDARPGLLRTFFELEDAFATPTYEIHVPPVNFEKLLFEDALAPDPDQKRAAQVQAEAQLSALRGSRMMGLALASWPNTVSAATRTLMPYFTKERTRVIEALRQPFKDAVATLSAKGCAPQTYYCSGLNKTYGQALSEIALAGQVLMDFWGNAYLTNAVSGYDVSIASDGPDERRNTADDTALSIPLSELGVMQQALGIPGMAQTGAFAPAGAAGAAAAAPATPPPTATAPAQSGGATNADGSRGESSEGPRVRSEFPETLYVNPALITDADGKASIDLGMADSITSWRVSALANAQNGALGGGQAAVKVFQDFFVDIAFPAELTRGDQVEFPIVVYNYLKSEQTVRLELEAAGWFSATGSTTPTLTLGPDEVKSARIAVHVDKVGTQTLTVRAFGTNAQDAVARSVRVVPDGVPVQQARSGSLQPNEGTTLAVNVPSNAIAGSPLLYLDLYPAFTSQAVQGLDSMLQTPSGCFEQTTSTTWPNVLVTSYLEQTHQNTPEIQLKAESLISAGYQRLLTYEHRSGGFSWFGEQDPMPDVSVTAFGLMEFADMAKVAEVDEAMIARTQAWLAAQQSGDGSFAGGMTEFFSFQTSALRNTAFVVWALADSGYKGPELASGVEYVKAHSRDEADDYTLALTANALAAAAPSDAALTALLARLDEHKQVDGVKASWQSGTEQTTFYGGGRDSDVATTALIAHALIRTNSYPDSAKHALESLVAAKDVSGNFGSTQASIWSLKALMIAASHGTEGAVGELRVTVDSQPPQTVAFTKDQWDVNTRVDLSSLATSGNHNVALSFAGTGQVSYNLVSSHHLPWALAPQPSAAPLALSVSYDRTTLAVDETVTATLRIDNTARTTQSMLLVTAGLPPGFELMPDDLDAYLQDGTISRYERTAKQLILYITSLAPNAKLQLNYRLRASMPLRATDGGSEVYLYYQPERKARSGSTTLVVNGG